MHRFAGAGLGLVGLGLECGSASEQSNPNALNGVLRDREGFMLSEHSVRHT